MFGLVWLGILSALRDPEEIWQSRMRRTCFVLGVAVMLGTTAVIVAANNGSPSSGSAISVGGTPTSVGSPSHESIWAFCLGCAAPLTVLAFLLSRSALVRPILGAVGTLLAVLVLAAAGEAFRPQGQPLNGLAATAHHHGLVIAALLVPLLVVTLACLPLRRARTIEFSVRPIP